MSTSHEPKTRFTGKPSKQMQQVLEQLALEDVDMGDPTLLSAAQGREMAALANRRWNLDLPQIERVDDLTLTGADGNELEARLFTPEIRSDGLIFFIHGGGFAFCDIDTHERFTRCLANESACAVLSINYRLAPEHPYPAGLNDSIALYRQLDLVHRKCPWTKGVTAIAGDSAGANLALALLIHEQREARPTPDFALLFYGVYGTDFTTDSYTEHAEGPGLTGDKMQRYLDWYKGSTLEKDSLISFNHISDEELSALPPLYLNAAEIDPLCSDSTNLHARLKSLGRNDELHIIPGVVHGFLQMSLRLNAAIQATKHAANAFRELARQSLGVKTI